MKVKDITASDDIAVVLVSHGRFVSYNSHNRHADFEDYEVKNIRIDNGVGCTFLFAEVEYVSDKQR